MYRDLVNTYGGSRTTLERQFAGVLVERGWVAATDLLHAMSAAGQQRMTGEPVDVLVVLRRSGSLSPERIEEALTGLDDVPMRCPKCGGVTWPGKYVIGRVLTCPVDQAQMMPTLAPGSAAPESVPDALPAEPTSDFRLTAADASPMDSDTRLFANDYRFVRVLARTALSMVTLLEARDGSDQVVLKTLLSESTTNAKRMGREWALAQRVTHPNVVRIREAGNLDDLLYLAMDFIDAPSLRQRVANHGPLPLAMARDIILKMFAGLEALHEAGVIHRDIKPGNVLADGNGQVLIIDLGIASDDTGEMSRMTAASDFVGTPAYTAPEQFVSSRVDRRADIYSAGVTAHFILSGQQLFSAREMGPMLVERGSLDAIPKVSEIRSDVPGVFDHALRRLLEFDPEARIPTAREAAGLLARALPAE